MPPWYQYEKYLVPGVSVSRTYSHYSVRVYPSRCARRSSRSSVTPEDTMRMAAF